MLRRAYAQGVFPMAEGEAADAPVYWYQPPQRAVFPVSAFHIPRRLARLVRRCGWTLRWDDDFPEIMRQCAALRESGSWINPALLSLYTEWHHAGEAHGLSVFDGDTRIGGIYGVHLGGVFMAESMFSRVPNASSVALVVLMAGLAHAGVELVDVQFENPHLAKFHPQLWPHARYQQALDRLLPKPVILKADYFSLDGARSFTQSLTQTS